MPTKICESLPQFGALSRWQDACGAPTGMTGEKWLALLGTLNASTIDVIDRAYRGALSDLDVQPSSDVGNSKASVRSGLKRAIADLVTAGERDELRLRERAMCQAVASRFADER